MGLALEKLYGKRWLKELEREHNRPAREIIEQAWEFVRTPKEGAPQEGAEAATPIIPQEIAEKVVEPPKPQVEGISGKKRTATEISREMGIGYAEAAKIRDEENQEKKISSQETDLKKGKGHPDLQKYIASIGKINTGPRGKLTKDAKQLQALKSSNVRYADYDPKDEKLQVLFAPSGKSKSGEIYEYFDVPRKDVEKMMEGSGTAVTTGANHFRAWFGGKNPSIGRAFHDFIKKKDDKGDAVYPYRKISEKYVKDDDLIKIRGADTVFKTTQYVEAFEDLTLKSQAKTRAEGLKIVSDALRELPDKLLEEMIFDVTKNVSKEVKQARSKGKSKRFKGGKEAEIRRRVESKAAEKRRGGT